MILYTVNKLLGVLEPDAYRYSLGFHRYPAPLEHGIDIPGRMSGSKKHRAVKFTAISRNHTAYTTMFVENQIGNPGIEMHFSAMIENRIAHCFDYDR